MVAQKSKTQKIAKQVTVLNVYKFRNVARCCFEILSSDETTKYNTCFNGSASHAACGCDRFVKGHKECYHIEQLRPRAQAYFDSRKPVTAHAEGEISEQKMNDMAAYYEKEAAIKSCVAILTPEGVSVIDRSEVTEHDILAPLHNNNERQYEDRGGRLVPMR